MGVQQPAEAVLFPPSEGGGERVALVVDDQAEVAEMHASLLRKLGFSAQVLTDPRAVESALQRNPDVELVMLDMRMPGRDGEEVLRAIKSMRPDIGVFIATVVNDVQKAVAAIKAGAYNYLLKPVDESRLRAALQSYLAHKPKSLIPDARFASFVTCAPVFNEIFARILAFAKSDVPVLLQGETGTGKELLAQIIHAASDRAQRRFLPVNVAALSPQLFESEMFGHLRGSFTGALKDHDGYFQRVQDGTIFLDEIGELNIDLQSKLLRVLQSGSFSKVGGSEEIRLGARVLFATNRDLREEVRAGKFREDLYYRLSSHCVEVPPLRSRPEDIPLLSNYFLNKYRSQFDRAVSSIAPDAEQALKTYAFPGNVRELEGFVSSAVLLEQGPALQCASFPAHLRAGGAATGEGTIREARYTAILRALAECGGNQTLAAKRLGIARSTLHRQLKEFKTDGRH